MDRDYSIYELQRNIMRSEDLYEEKAWDRMIENSKKEQQEEVQEEEVNKKVDEILEKAQDYLKNNTKNITVKKLEAADLQTGEEERKVILVRDNAPECCKKCDFLALFKGQYFCMADGGEFLLEDVIRYNMRPLDCPWKTLPEKLNANRDGLLSGAYYFMSAVGWNSCIDAIEGRGKKEEKESEPEAKRVQFVEDRYVCPVCKWAPEQGSNFCPTCGTKLSWEDLDSIEPITLKEMIEEVDKDRRRCE